MAMGNGDDVTNENSNQENSVENDSMDWVQNVNVLDFNDDIDNLLDESDDDL